MRLVLFIILLITLTFIFFYPVLLNLNSHIAGFSSTDEPYGVIWSFWWMKYAFLGKLNVNLINMIACPFGIIQNTTQFFPLWGFMAKYIAIASNEILAYNLILMSTFILAGLTMYCLMFYLTKNFFASVFSALIYAFCPYHLVRVWQHFGTAQIQWMPLYILLLFKLKEIKNSKIAAMLGLTLALNYYFDVHYAYFMLIITVLFVFFIFLENHDRLGFLGFLFLGLSIGGLLILPAFLPFIDKLLESGKHAASARSLVRPFEDLFSQSVRPLSYLLPFTEQPILGNFTKMFVGSQLWGESLTEHNVFLGFMPVCLGVVALIKRKAILVFMKIKGINATFTLKFFFCFILLSWLFSQPPWWKVFGIKIYLPSYFMYKLLPMFRAYVRFAILVMLGVSVLAGFGLVFVMDKFKSRRIIAIAVAILFSVFALFEFWNIPTEHTINLSVYNKAYDWLRMQKGDFVVAEYPLDSNGPNETYKFYQTKHLKKIINGTLPGTYANTVAQMLVKLSSQETAQNLRWMGVKYVLVHTDAYKNSDLSQDLTEFSLIGKSSALRLVKSFDDIEVYEIIVSPLNTLIEEKLN